MRRVLRGSIFVNPASAGVAKQSGRREWWFDGECNRYVCSPKDAICKSFCRPLRTLKVRCPFSSHTIRCLRPTPDFLKPEGQGKSCLQAPPGVQTKSDGECNYIWIPLLCESQAGLIQQREHIHVRPPGSNRTLSRRCLSVLWPGPPGMQKPALGASASRVLRTLIARDAPITSNWRRSGNGVPENPESPKSEGPESPETIWLLTFRTFRKEGFRNGRAFRRLPRNSETNN